MTRSDRERRKGWWLPPVPVVMSGRPRLLAIALASLVLSGAAGENASRKDIDACVQEAAKAASAGLDGAALDPAKVSPNDPRLFDAVAQCLKSKGYVRVQDVGGICDDFILPQCFERN